MAGCDAVVACTALRPLPDKSVHTEASLPVSLSHIAGLNESGLNPMDDPADGLMLTDKVIAIMEDYYFNL
jgi:hypothetical protein